MRITLKQWSDICKLPNFNSMSNDSAILSENRNYMLSFTDYQKILALPQPVFAYATRAATIGNGIRIRVSGHIRILLPYDFIDKIVVE